MIALPTTAGTGSEVGRSAVATMRDTGKKTIFFAPDDDPERGDPRSAADRDHAARTSPRRPASTRSPTASRRTAPRWTTRWPRRSRSRASGSWRANLVRAVADGKDLEARARHAQGRDLRRGGVPEGARRVPLARASAVGRVRHAPRPRQRAVPAGRARRSTAASIQRSSRKIARAARRARRRRGDAGLRVAGAVRALRQQIGLPDGLREAGIPRTRCRARGARVRGSLPSGNPAPARGKI